MKTNILKLSVENGGDAPYEIYGKLIGKFEENDFEDWFSCYCLFLGMDGNYYYNHNDLWLVKPVKNVQCYMSAVKEYKRLTRTCTKKKYATPCYNRKYYRMQYRPDPVLPF